MEFFSVYKMANFYVRKLQLGTQIGIYLCSAFVMTLLLLGR